MQRHLLLFLLLATLVGAAVWFLLRPGPELQVLGPSEEIERGTGDGAPDDVPGRVPGRLEGAGRAEPVPPKPPPYRPVRPEDVPRGVLSVQAVGPDGTPFLPGDARIFLEPLTRSFFWAPTGVPDLKTGVWRFEKLPAGRVRASVRGDHVVEASTEVTVEADQETSATIHADRAGAVAYRVVLYSGQKPPQVTLTLLDGKRQPVRAWWQVRALDALTSPRADVKVTQGPEGVVYGVPPGRYHLRATSPAEEWDEVEVEIAAGQTVPAEIRLRE